MRTLQSLAGIPANKGDATAPTQTVAQAVGLPPAPPPQPVNATRVEAARGEIRAEAEARILTQADGSLRIPFSLVSLLGVPRGGIVYALPATHHVLILATMPELAGVTSLKIEFGGSLILPRTILAKCEAGTLANRVPRYYVYAWRDLLEVII